MKNQLRRTLRIETFENRRTLDGDGLDQVDVDVSDLDMASVDDAIALASQSSIPEIQTMTSTSVGQLNVLDIDQNGIVTPIDVLLVIEALQFRSGLSSELRAFPVDVQIGGGMNFDVNDDGMISALDVTFVIDALTQQQTSDASLPANSTLVANEPSPNDDSSTDGDVSTGMAIRMAGYSTLTLGGVGDFKNVVITINEKGLSGLADGSEVDVTTDDSGRVFVDKVKVPVQVVELESGNLLQPTYDTDGVTVIWPDDNLDRT